MRKLSRKAKALILTGTVAGLTLLGVVNAGAESPYKFGPHEVQCQASPDQPKCVGSH